MEEQIIGQGCKFKQGKIKRKESTVETRFKCNTRAKHVRRRSGQNLKLASRIPQDNVAKYNAIHTAGRNRSKRRGGGSKTRKTKEAVCRKRETCGLARHFVAMPWQRCRNVGCGRDHYVHTGTTNGVSNPTTVLAQCPRGDYI